MWALSLALELLTSFSLIASGTRQAQNVYGIFLKKKKFFLSSKYQEGHVASPGRFLPKLHLLPSQKEALSPGLSTTVSAKSNV